MSSTKHAEEQSANPDREWKHPEGPNAGLTDQMPNAPQSGVAKAATTSDTTAGIVSEPGIEDREQKNAYENVHSL